MFSEFMIESFYLIARRVAGYVTVYATPLSGKMAGQKTANATARSILAFFPLRINALQKSATSQNNRFKIITWQPFEKYSPGRLYFFSFIIKAANFSYPKLRFNKATIRIK
jgi:hypothetical protein